MDGLMAITLILVFFALIIYALNGELQTVCISPNISTKRILLTDSCLVELDIFYGGQLYL